MKLKLKIILFAMIFISLLCILSNQVIAKTEVNTDSSGMFQYTVLKDGTISITKYLREDTNIVFPSKLDEYNVESIEANVLNNVTEKENIKSITIEEGIERIEGLYIPDECGTYSFYRSF